MDLTKITTPYGLLDEATQKELKLHHQRGGDIEFWPGADGWNESRHVLWLDNLVYRAKPKPIKPREIWVVCAPGYFGQICYGIGEAENCFQGCLGREVSHYREVL